MNILYTTDQNFIPQVAASMCSVMENNTEVEHLHFYIFGLNLESETASTLDAFVKGYHRELDIIPLKDIQSYYSFSFDTSGWRPIVLARLLIDKLLPESVSRIIYMDGDTIVRSSLSALYETDMHGKPIGGCQEATYNKKNIAALHMTGIPYINAGVLLIDIGAWRQQHTGEKIITYYAEHNGKLFANDQDAINGTLKQQLFLLPLCYNYCNTYDYYPYWALKKMAAPAPFIDKSNYEAYRRNPAIIHYLGEERPWREGNRHRFRDDYLSYLSKTPYRDTPMEQGWQGYFKLFGLFNAFTKPFPMLRHGLITSLIPAFMAWRKGAIKKKA